MVRSKLSSTHDATLSQRYSFNTLAPTRILLTQTIDPLMHLLPVVTQCMHAHHFFLIYLTNFSWIQTILMAIIFQLPHVCIHACYLIINRTASPVQNITLADYKVSSSHISYSMSDTRCFLFCPVTTFVNKSAGLSSDHICPVNFSHCHRLMDCMTSNCIKFLLNWYSGFEVSWINNEYIWAQMLRYLSSLLCIMWHVVYPP